MRRAFWEGCSRADWRAWPPWRVLWGALLLLCVAQTVAAQEEEPPPPPEEALPPTQENPLEVAREHMERGQALYAAGRFIESAEEFLRAYEAQPFAAFLYNAGVSYEKVDDPGRAADYFARYLTADPQAEDSAGLLKRIERLRGLARAHDEQLAAQTAADQAARDSSGTAEAIRASQAAQKELEAARQRLGELEAQLAQARGAQQFKSLLSVQTQPLDATIILKDQNGQLLAKGTGSPFAQTLDEGRYTVQVDHPKYKSISTPITIAPGKVYVIITEMSQGQFLGFLRVVSSVPGARVFMDKKEEGAVGKTPYQNAIATGKHHIWIEKPGYEPTEQDIEVGVGDTTEVKTELTRVDYGRIRVVANRPDAEVFIDGKSAGMVPVERDVKGREHTVKVSAPNMKDWKEDVVVANGQVTPVRVRLRPAANRAGAWVTAGVAAGVLGGAITCSVLGNNTKKDLEKARDTGVLATNDERFTRGKILYISADVGYGVALGLAGLATYYFLRDPMPDSEGRSLEPRDWTFNPYVSPTQAGAQVRANF
jgi:hypothetical protein